MGKFWLTIIMLILLALAGGVIYLMTVDLAPPAGQVEKILPDDKFPQ